ncbi:DUF4303 domain-containing protein [Capnocytophaga sp.]|uniref:DUF4303 domain-containing protein n=1 Tax=Capnocytophaga sp. TaxID=44737 RepID=UPI0026DC4CEB|nr:DUF4303 domain-containing protein [Capnocytophaga sp.]MDO5106088.1 DUF4303 domain-containing protein [Capnocytophaga sp.]
MNQSQKQLIEQLAAAEIRQSFAFIKNQTDEAQKDIAAYYFYLVDDFFAVGNAAITHQDFENWQKSETDPDYNGILNAIWSGECEIYEGDFVPISQTPENWLDGQTPLYKEAYLLVEGLDDYDRYNQIRSDFEQCLINALKKCDAEGVFGNRTENKMLVFAFYIDDYDENGENSVLYRSAKALNDEAGQKQLISL